MPMTRKPQLKVVPQPHRPVEQGKCFAIFCDEPWIVHGSGAEPACFCDENEVLDLFVEWLRQRREREVARLEADRRRGDMRGVSSEQHSHPCPAMPK